MTDVKRLNLPPVRRGTGPFFERTGSVFSWRRCGVSWQNLLSIRNVDRVQNISSLAKYFIATLGLDEGSDLT